MKWLIECSIEGRLIYFEDALFFLKSYFYLLCLLCSWYCVKYISFSRFYFVNKGEIRIIYFNFFLKRFGGYV
jgi:hypothetical protein